MKQITIISLLAALIFGACGGEQPSKEERNIKSLKKELAEKKTALKTLKQEIAALEEQLETLEPSKSMARTLVTVNTFPKKNFATYIEVQATVQSDDAYKISSEVGGRLIRFSLKEGSVVTKGQLIGEVDMEGVSKQLDELETALDLARTAYENQKRLWEQKIGSEIQYLQAKNQKERLEKSIETIRFQTTKSKIYAPASGEISIAYSKQGDVVSPGMPLAEILNLNRVQVEAEVPEIYLKNIKKGDAVNVKFPALDRETRATVSLIGQKINPANRTFKVEIDIPNSGDLKPNLLAVVQVRDKEQQSAVVLPSEIIQQDMSGQSFVFVKSEDENGAVAKKVFVQLGETYDGETAVIQGLTGNEQLIIKGARELKNNELIEIKAE